MRVRKRKFDGSLKHEWQGDLVDAVGEDWLVVYHAAERHEKQLGGRPAEVPAHALRYFNLRQPLTVLFAFDHLGRLLDAKCDAGLPATLDGRMLEWVDLDLDLIVRPDGSWEAVDEEDFAVHAAEMAYPDDVRAAAREGMKLAQELVTARAFPFDGSAERLLGRLLAAEGPL